MKLIKLYWDDFGSSTPNYIIAAEDNEVDAVKLKLEAADPDKMFRVEVDPPDHIDDTINNITEIYGREEETP